jgi:hypothetical protein
VAASIFFLLRRTRLAQLSSTSLAGFIKGTIKHFRRQASVIRTTFARIGWTVCSETNTFLRWHVYEWSGGDCSGCGPPAATRGMWREGNVTNDRRLGSAEVSSLPDAERDASDVVQLLAGLAALLDRGNVVLDDDTRVMLGMALNGGASATRVLEYLRALQGSGDGVAVAVPPRLGPWREWVPPRGQLFGETAATARVDELPRNRRRVDPGE